MLLLTLDSFQHPWPVYYSRSPSALTTGGQLLFAFGLFKQMNMLFVKRKRISFHQVRDHSGKPMFPLLKVVILIRNKFKATQRLKEN